MLISALKQHATPYRIHMLPLLNRRGWKQLIFKNVCMPDVLWNSMKHIVQLKC
jgi:hypothetical protein